MAGFDLDLNVSRKWYVDADPGTDLDAWRADAVIATPLDLLPLLAPL